MNHPGRKMNTLFLITLILYLVTVMLLSLLAQRSLGIGLISMLIVGELAVVVPGLIFLLLFHCSIPEWIPIRPVRWSTIGFTFLLTFLIMPLLYFLNILSQLFSSNVTVDLMEQTDGIPGAVLLLTVGLIGPVCEEITFRGVLFTGFKRSGRIVGAILWTAFLFGLFHMNLNQFGYAMVIGIVSALLVEGTGSLIPSLIMHILVNSYNVIQLLLIQYLSGFLGKDFSEIADSAQEVLSQKTILMTAGALLAPATIATALAAVTYIAILKREGTMEHVRKILRFKKGTDEEEGEAKSPILSVTGFIGIAICLFMIFGMETLLHLLGM